MTPTGTDARMQVDQKKYMAEGRCFICHKKGHISKDCLKKMKREVRAVEVEVPLTLETKIEEVKD